MRKSARHCENFSENGEKGRNGEKRRMRAATRGGFGVFGRVLVRRRGSEKRRTDDDGEMGKLRGWGGLRGV